MCNLFGGRMRCFVSRQVVLVGRTNLARTIVALACLGLPPTTVGAAHASYYETNRLDAAIYLDFDVLQLVAGVGSARKTYDLSGNYLNATENAAGAVAFPQASYNRFVDFAGDSNYLMVPYHQSLDFDDGQNYSVVLWVWAPQDGQHAELVHAPSAAGKYAYRVYLHDSGVLRFCLSDGANHKCNDTNYTDYFEQWVQLSFVKNGAQICTAINDQPLVCQGSSGVAGTRAGSGTLVLGLHPSLVNDFNGRMDDFFIFNTALSQASIATLFQTKGSCGNNVCDANENPKTCAADCPMESDWEDAFLDAYYQNYAGSLSTNRDFVTFTYNSNNYIRSFLDMYQVTLRPWYLEQAIKVAEKFICYQKSPSQIPSHPLLDSEHALLANLDADSGGHLELPADRYQGVYASRLEVSRLYRS